MRKSLVLGAAVVFMTVSAHAQSPSQAQSQVAQKVTPSAPLRLSAVKVEGQLRTRLASKQKFDAAKMPVNYLGDVPVLRLEGGKSVKLSPVDEAIPNLGTVQTPAVALVEKRKAAISAWKPGVRAAAVVNIADHLPAQSPVKDQGPRGSCGAFANVAGIEAWLRRNENVVRDLSENHAHEIFMQTGGGTCHPDKGVGLISMLGIREKGVCAESAFPYTGTCPASVPSACSGASEKYRIASLYPLSFPNFPPLPTFDVRNTTMLETLLDAGFDIMLSIKIAGSDWSDSTASGGTIDVQTSGGEPVGSVGNHNVLLTGYDRPRDKFIIKNSWGTSWGHDGYGWLSYDYIETYSRYGYAIVSVAH